MIGKNQKLKKCKKLKSEEKTSLIENKEKAEERQRMSLEMKKEINI